MFNLTPLHCPPQQCYTACTHNRPWHRAGRRRRAASIVYRPRLRRAAYITWFACGGDCLFGHRYRSSKDPLNDVWRSNHFFPFFTYAFHLTRPRARTRTHAHARRHGGLTRLIATRICRTLVTIVTRRHVKNAT